jgi:CheY-like chemotaxis protein
MSFMLLHVEDDPNDVLLLRRAFQKAGIEIAIASVGDGVEAVNYLGGQGAYADRTKHPLPSLILLDLKLPKKSGLEVLEWLRGQGDLRLIPVIVLTSSQDAGDVRRAYELGANSYLVKPAQSATLGEMMKALNGYWMIFNKQPDLTTASPLGDLTHGSALPR